MKTTCFVLVSAVICLIGYSKAPKGALDDAKASIERSSEGVDFLRDPPGILLDAAREFFGTILPPTNDA